MIATVQTVSLSPVHGFGKRLQPVIHLLAGEGVQGDAHCGASVQHLYLKRRNPNAANRMQLHLLQSELFDDFAADGICIAPGQLGENITTRNIDLLHLPLGTRLHLGATAVVELTGRRTPCKQIDTFMPGLMRGVTLRDADGRLSAKIGVMATVLASGAVNPTDKIIASLPAQPYTSLPLI